MAGEIKIGKQIIGERQLCFFIAEIGHNHQGNLKVALDMIKIAAGYGVNAVKFQKRHNKNLYTKGMYNKAYDNENSFGLTYGEHREFLEFDWDEYVALKKCAEANNVEFMCTAFDFESVDFLEKLGVNSYKVASGDLTNLPLIEYIAKLNKPMFVSTGASTLDEIKAVYETILKYNKQLCLMYTVCAYPTEYEDLNLRFIETMIREFPEAIIGYSGHDNGILAAVLAYMLGAKVVEKHFTINHSWKGTDHKFSLEPEGLRKQVRDLRRIEVSLGNGRKVIKEIELDARDKMGKSIYTKTKLCAGDTLTQDKLCIKSPGSGIAPYFLKDIIGRTLKVDLPEEAMLSFDDLEDKKEYAKVPHPKRGKRLGAIA